MQRKDLALRVLSTAAIMSIVTSIAAPAFADIYYIGNGSIDVVTKKDTDGNEYVEVKQGDNTYTDTSDEIVIKDGTSEADTTLTEAKRAEGTRANPAVAPAAGAATQELEATGSADAAGESQPDPDAGFTLSETEEDSAQTQEGKDITKKDEDTPDPSTEPPKKDVVYQYAPADPEPEQQATKPTLSTSADPTAETREATQANAPAAAPTTPTAPAADPPAEGSVKNPTTNVIKVVNNWVGAAAKELKIRLSNVNIKTGNSAYEAAMTVSGGGTTKVELDGQNVLDSSEAWSQAGLRKRGKGTLIITDETDDTGKKITSDKTDGTGSLTAKGGYGNGAAGIGGGMSESTENITIEGYATVDATGGGSGAGIGGGSNGSATDGAAKNITIQGHSNVTARAGNGAAIGSGYGSYETSATGIVIRDYAVVDARATGGAAIGGGAHYGGNNNTEVEVTIGTDGKTEAKENVRVTAIGSGIAIGNGRKMTTVTIQGHVSILTASTNSGLTIGSGKGNVTVSITDNVAIDTDDTAVDDPDSFFGYFGIGGGNIDAGDSTRKVVVNIDGGKDGKVKLGERSALSGYYGAISGTEVNIGDNVLLKMKQSERDGKYINMNGAEAEVGTRSNTPGASGLVNSIGDNTELWYTDFKGELQKIVHSKNLCEKNEINHKDANCTEKGWVKYECTFESSKGALHPEHTGQWEEDTPIDPNAHNYVKTTVPPTCGAQGYDEYICTNNPNHKYRDNFVDATGNHQFNAWHQTKAPTCMEEGEEQHECEVCGKPETRKVDKLDHVEELRGAKEPTCTEPGYTGDKWCTRGDHLLEKGSVIPALRHHWKDNGDGTHTCTNCGATEGQPVNTNSALELRVVDAEGMNQPFTVSQNGTLRTYTGAYDIATLTGDLDTLRYLQDHGAQTIQFVTNGQTSSFAINDLLAQGSGSEVFYLTHRGAEEPTLLLVEADHSDLVKD